LADTKGLPCVIHPLNPSRGRFAFASILDAVFGFSHDSGCCDLVGGGNGSAKRLLLLGLLIVLDGSAAQLRPQLCSKLLLQRRLRTILSFVYEAPLARIVADTGGPRSARVLKL